MAKWSSKKTLPQDINNGFEFYPNDGLHVSDINAIANGILFANESLDNIVDGSPKGVYPSLSALQAAFPSGDQGVYITSDTGHWFYWNSISAEWVDGGVYQSFNDSEIDDIKNDLDTAEDKIAKLQQDAIFTNAKVAVNEQDISALKERAEHDESNIDSLQQGAASINEKVLVNTQDISSLKERADLDESNIDMLQQTSVNHTDQLSDLTTTVNDLSATVQPLDAKVANCNATLVMQQEGMRTYGKALKIIPEKSEMNNGMLSQAILEFNADAQKDSYTTITVEELFIPESNPTRTTAKGATIMNSSCAEIVKLVGDSTVDRTEIRSTLPRSITSYGKGGTANDHVLADGIVDLTSIGELKKWETIYKATNLLNLPDQEEIPTDYDISVSVEHGKIYAVGTPSIDYATVYSQDITTLLTKGQTYSFSGVAKVDGFYLSVILTDTEGVTTTLEVEQTFTWHPHLFVSATLVAQTGKITETNIASGAYLYPMLVEGEVIPTHFLPYTTKKYIKESYCGTYTFSEKDTWSEVVPTGTHDTFFTPDVPLDIVTPATVYTVPDMLFIGLTVTSFRYAGWWDITVSPDGQLVSQYYYQKTADDMRNYMKGRTLVYRKNTVTYTPMDLDKDGQYVVANQGEEVIQNTHDVFASFGVSISYVVKRLEKVEHQVIKNTQDIVRLDSRIDDSNSHITSLEDSSKEVNASLYDYALRLRAVPEDTEMSNADLIKAITSFEYSMQEDDFALANVSDYVLSSESRKTAKGLKVVDDSYAKIVELYGDTNFDGHGDNKNLRDMDTFWAYSYPAAGGTILDSLAIKEAMPLKWLSKVIASTNILLTEDTPGTTKDGITYNIQQGIITLDGTATKDTRINLPSAPSIIDLPAGTVFKVFYNEDSILAGSCNIILYPASARCYLYAPSMGKENVDVSVSAVPDGYSYCMINISKGSTFKNQQIKPMLVPEGIEPKTFVPNLNSGYVRDDWGEDYIFDGTEIWEEVVDAPCTSAKTFMTKNLADKIKHLHSEKDYPGNILFYGLYGRGEKQYLAGNTGLYVDENGWLHVMSASFTSIDVLKEKIPNQRMRYAATSHKYSPAELENGGMYKVEYEGSETRYAYPRVDGISIVTQYVVKK